MIATYYKAVVEIRMLYLIHIEGRDEETMSDELGRSKFVELPADARPSFWRSIAGRVYEGILHSLGRPARLENAIASGQLIPCPLIAPIDTFWTRSVVYYLVRHGCSGFFRYPTT